MIYRSEEVEKNAVYDAASQMAVAARTAPKGCGIDDIETLVLDGEAKDALAEEMRLIGKEVGSEFFARDADNVDASICVVFIGARHASKGLSDCASCGFETCADMYKAGGRCTINVVDLGIAVGSAVAIAADNRIDNRIMHTAGKAALRQGLFSEDVNVCYGIPLSVTGKSPYFDRDLVR
ncbi:MAG: DUF2148 domain-containing protein [Clostridiales Family XIII bacterium]|jgi:uncharacterized ferredoxin-like protein|nr:DUF2148 domain-containing protein [Clostridiales Family XIII bacterium]